MFLEFPSPFWTECSGVSFGRVKESMLWLREGGTGREEGVMATQNKLQQIVSKTQSIGEA